MQRINVHILVLAWVGVSILLCSCTKQDPRAEASPGQVSATDRFDATAPLATPAPKQTKSAKLEGVSDQDPIFFEKIGTMKSEWIVECSGLARSFHRPDAFWAINDSGNSPHVFCVTSKGDLLARVELVGARNRDWESMAQFSTAEGNFLMVADVGDNSSRHDQCQLYIIPEPELEQGDSPIELKVEPGILSFVYEDGPRDCEAVAIDPVTLDLWIFEKQMKLSLRRTPGTYQIAKSQWLPTVVKHFSDRADGAHQEPTKLSSEKTHSKKPQISEPITAKRLMDLGHLFVTGADFSPDSQKLILSTYSHAILYQRNDDQSWLETFRTSPTLVPLPIQRQCEAVFFLEDSAAVLTTSEFAHQPIWRVDVMTYLKFIKD